MKKGRERRCVTSPLPNDKEQAMSHTTLADLKGMSSGEIALWAQIRWFDGWVREYRFAPPRRWRFDFANPQLKLAIEVDGGTGAMRHGQLWEREKDYEKRNEAIALGWRVLIGTTAMALDGRLVAYLKRCLHHP